MSDDATELVRAALQRGARTGSARRPVGPRHGRIRCSPRWTAGQRPARRGPAGARRRRRASASTRSTSPRSASRRPPSTSRRPRWRWPASASPAARSTTASPTCSTSRASGPGAFDLVVEIITVQALPEELRAPATAAIAATVAPGGTLLRRLGDPRRRAGARPAVAAHPRAGRGLRGGRARARVSLERAPLPGAPAERRWLAVLAPARRTSARRRAGITRVDGAADRGLRPDRRHADRRARGPRRLDRLAVPAALRLAGLLRGAARHERTGAGCSRPRAPPRTAPLPRRHTGARDRVRDRRRRAAGRRLHADPRRGARRRPRRGGRGSVAMRMELVLRFDYGPTTPWVGASTAACRRSRAPTPCSSAGRPTRGGDLPRSPTSCSRRRRVPFVLTWHLSHPPPSPSTTSPRRQTRRGGGPTGRPRATSTGRHRELVMRA